MLLLHGTEISADEIEAEIARWTAERFARLCNAVAWAMAEVDGRRQTIPVFTERVHVADNGIDAEWERVLGAGEASIASGPFLRPDLNVFQYKKRGAGPGNRAAVVAELLSDLRRAVHKVEARTGKALASYVLWTNVDLTVDQNAKLRAGILEGDPEEGESRAHAIVVGAAELAAIVNDLPHIRSAFFATAAFQDWGRAFEAHERQSLVVDSSGRLAPLTGRDRTIGDLCRLVDREAVRAIVVTGPHMIGKSRLILEGTRHRDVDVVEALDAGALSADSMSRLAKAGRETIILLQDASAEVAERVGKQALAIGGTIKVIVTLPTREGSPLPNFGLDDRACLLQIPPLDEPAARQLFTYHLGENRVDYGIESWIIEQAGGVPGVLLAAARFGRELRPGAGTFTEQIGAAFEAKLRRVVPSSSAQTAFEIAALLTQVRVELDEDAELAALCRPLGAETYAFRAAIEPLEAAGYLSRRGSFVEPTLPILANRLAARLVQGRPSEVMAVFQALADGGRRRLLRRLAQVPDHHAARFWSLLFDPSGPLGSLQAVLSNTELFRAAAAAGNPRAVEIVHEGLRALPPDRRRGLDGERRRALVSSLQELMAATLTAEPAFRALALLAEAETEDYGNNATGSFCHGAYPLNSQMPLPLARRLGVLEEMLAPERDAAAGIVALEAASNALGSGRPIILTPSRGARPAGGLPLDMTWDDVRAYSANLLNAIGKAAADPRPPVRRKAKLVWAGAAEQLVYDAGGNAPRGISAFEQIVDRVLRGDPEFTVARTVDTIVLCRTNLGGALAARTGAAGSELAAALTGLLTKLKTGSFEVRLRWRLGNSWRELDDDEAEAQDRPDPFQAKALAITGLAKEACLAPEKLSPDLIAWCGTDEANAARMFWRALGEHDDAGLWTETLVELARDETSWPAVVDYLAGVSARDAPAGQTVFVRMNEAGGVRPEAIAYASTIAEGADRAASRAAAFVRQGTLALGRAAGLAGDPSFQDRVSPAAFAGLLEAIVGEGIEHPELVIHALWFWFHHHPPTESADPVVIVAWKCVEARLPTGNDHSGYEAGTVAAGLIRLDPDRGFRLVDAASARLVAGMRNTGSDTYWVWSPFDQAGPRQPCWEALRALDRDRALTIVLDHVVLAGRDGLILQLQLKNLIRMPDDVEFLRTYIAHGEAQAEAVASAIGSHDEGFWDVACEIYERHPENERLKAMLGTAAGGMAGGFFGGFAVQAEEAAANIEVIRNQLDDRFPRTRLWLGEILAAYRQTAVDAKRREEDRDIDQ